jgi:hypothetical protein
MSRFTSNLVVAAALGHLAAPVAFIDPLFIPLILLGPIISGAIAATRRTPLRWIATVWISFGLSTIWTRWVFVAHDEVLFHLTITVVMTLLAGLGYEVTRFAGRSRRAA